MRQGAAQAIQLPNDQRIAGFHIFQAGFQTGAIVTSARRLVRIKMSAIDAGSGQRVALKIDRLPIIS